MSLELLPNEILFICLHYLDIWQIFHSFDHLNARFNRLIRTQFSYKLNFENVTKPKLIQYCELIHRNPQIKQQVYSLRLSINPLYDQTRIFRAWFSLDEFPYLQILSFIGDQNTEVNAKSKLSLSNEIFDRLVEDCSRTKLPSDGNRLLQTELSAVTHITLVDSYLDDLVMLLKNASLLEFLKIHQIINYGSMKEMDIYPNVVMKYLTIEQFESNFEDLEFLLLHTPNLTFFRLITSDTNEFLDALHWECLINSLLCQLSDFQFLFSNLFEQNDLVNKFEQFQTDFWLRQHHWQTNYSLLYGYRMIHTIPYPLTDLSVKFAPLQYALNKSNEFSYVTKLTLLIRIYPDKEQYYFPNVTTLTLVSSFRLDDLVYANNFVIVLTRFVNLSNLKHLNIQACRGTYVTLILFEILKRSPRLSALTFELELMPSILENESLCHCLNQMIKRVNCDYGLLHRLKDVEKFCQVFSHIEQLTYNGDRREHILYLLNHLSELSLLTIRLPPYRDPVDFVDWFKKRIFKIYANYYIEEFNEKNMELYFCIWIEHDSHLFSIMSSF